MAVPQLSGSRVTVVFALTAIIVLGAVYRGQVARTYPQSAQFAPMARDILRGAAYPKEPFYPPGLVWAYLGVFGLFGDAMAVERAFAVVLATTESALLAWMAWRLAGPIASLFSAALLAFWPFGTALALGGGGELSPVLLFVTAGLHVLLSAQRRDSLALYAFSGAILAMPGLVRSDAFLLAPWLAIGLVLFGEQHARRRVLCAVVVGCSALAGYVPWAARNYRVTGEVILTGIQARLLGYSLYAGIGEISGRGGAAFFDDDRNYLLGLGSPVFVNDYRRANDILLARSRQIIERDPLLLVRSGLNRLPVFWGRGGRTYHLAGEDRPTLYPGPGIWAATVRRFQSFLSPAMLWIGAGASLLRGKASRSSWPVWAVVAYYVLVHLPVHMEGRYLLPLFPMLGVLCGGAAAGLFAPSR